MMGLDRCRCYFDLMLHMNNASPEIFCGGISGYLQSISKITYMRDKLKRLCMDYMSTDDDSVIFICFNCLKDQICITHCKRFFNNLLEMECFNFKMKAHALCIDALFAGTMTIHKICYECLTLCSKAFLLSDFHTLLLGNFMHCFSGMLYMRLFLC